MAKRKRKSSPLSTYQKLYAKILYGRGMTQEQIGNALDVSKQVIWSIKKKEGDWDGYRLPKLTFRDLILLIKDYTTRQSLKLINGELDEDANSIKDLRMLISSMKDLQEQVDEISARDDMLSSQNFMKWVAEHSKNGLTPLEAAQQYHDIQANALQI